MNLLCRVPLKELAQKLSHYYFFNNGKLTSVGLGMVKNNYFLDRFAILIILFIDLIKS